MKFRSLLAATTLFAFVATLDAQPPGGGGKGRTRGARPGGGQRGGASDGILRYLEMPEVQKELGLTDSEKGSIPLLRDELKEGDRKFGESLQGTPREEMRSKFADRTKEVEKQVGEVLGAAKMKRFNQIRLQLAGITGALMQTQVQTDLKITDDQKTKLGEAGVFMGFGGGQRGAGGQPGQGRQRGQRGVGGQPGGAGGQGGDPADREARRKETAEKAMAILTAEQKTKWNELIGTPITFKAPERQRGQGGKGKGGDDAEKDPPSVG